MAEESPQADGADIRKRALVRLGIAALVTAAALAGLWWLDKSGKEEVKPPPPPTPIVTAPPPSVAPPLEPPAEESPQVAAPEMAAPPPPVMGVLPQPPAPAAPPREPRPAKTEPAPAAPPAKPVVPGKGYVVQLGVFSNPENAQELVERLRRQGISAHTETRVQVGPFRSRAEADKARAELGKLGYTAVVAPANGLGDAR